MADVRDPDTSVDSKNDSPKLEVSVNHLTQGKKDSKDGKES
jgi:hypothetical protein